MIKINDKKFLKYINETILDFKRVGFCPYMGLLEALEKIKLNKGLDILSSTLLFKYLEFQKNYSNYAIAPQLLQEHEYMANFLLKYYIFDVDMARKRTT